MDDYLLQILLIVILVALSGLFSSTEAALLALGPAKVQHLLDEEGVRSRLLSLWRERPDSVLATLMIANNLVVVLASVLAAFAVMEALEDLRVKGATGTAAAIAVGLMSFLMVTIGEVLPRTVARHNPMRFLPLFPLTLAACFVFRPLSFAVLKATKRVVEPDGGPGPGSAVTGDEIETMIRIGTAQGGLSDQKHRMLASVIEFSETMTQEVMVPRTDVCGFAQDEPLEEVLRTVAGKKFSRYPVYEEDLDQIVGIVTVKDLLGYLSDPERGPFSLATLSRRHKVLIVPETKKIGDLLRDFQRERVQMAIAVDEFGGTAGIVTMEDVIEEIVGEIYDEHDSAESYIRKVGEGRYLVQARTPVEELASTFDIKLPEQDIYETVGGLVLNQAGRVPDRGDTVDFAGLRFEVHERTRTRLLTLAVSRLPKTDTGVEKTGDE